MKVFYVDAIRTFKSSNWCLGENIRIFDYQYHLPNLVKNSQQAKDVKRFRWFSQNYLGFDDEKNLVTDVRYYLIPNQIAAMWGIIIDDQRALNEHATWWTSRGVNKSQLALFIDLLKGAKCKYIF